MKIRCVAIDDHQTSLDLIRDYVSKLDYLEWAGGFLDPVRAINEMDSLKPDLIFIDMQMPGMSGLDFLKVKKPKQPVIIISDYKDFAFDSYAVSNENGIVILDYLAKIILLPRFIQACEKAKNHIQNIRGHQDNNLVFAKTEGAIMEQLDLKEVQYIEADTQIMKFFTLSKDKPIIVRITMGELEEKFKQIGFLRIHRKHLVNPRFVKQFQTPDLIILKNNTELSIGKTYQGDVKLYFNTRRLG